MPLKHCLLIKNVIYMLETCLNIQPHWGSPCALIQSLLYEILRTSVIYRTFSSMALSFCVFKV